MSFGNHYYFPVSTTSFPKWIDRIMASKIDGPLPESANVVVIGSGFAGTAVSYYLQNEVSSDQSIVMLEARAAVSGATSRNSGLIKPEYHRNHGEYVHKFGSKIAGQLVNFEIDNMKELARILALDSNLNEKADFQERIHLDAYSNPRSAETAINDFYAFMENEDVSVELKRKVQLLFGDLAKQLSNVPTTPFVIHYPNGSVNSYDFVTAMLTKAIQRGLDLYTNTLVEEVQQLDSGVWKISTSKGEIFADKVVFTTNAYTQGLLPEFSKSIIPIRGVSSQVDVSNTGNEHSLSIGSDIYVPQSKKLLYSSLGELEKQTNFMDNYNTVDDSTVSSQSLEYLQDNLGKVNSLVNATTTSSSSGIMAYTDDHFPYVGQLNELGKLDAYILAGCNCSGLSRMLLCSKELAKAVALGSELSDRIPAPYKVTRERMGLVDKLMQSVLNEREIRETRARL
ncbi:BA75_01515T0 [Komagataella pastoris]|uniref:BA75_01515T0 n=1 Tax=Komagataella pastoris TaxID=4922 RepID=A0A1B2J6C5_PICPA|nr:BA75_01515T0 [Komagataella pastoris]